MDGTWKVEVWGVRGAMPIAHRDYLEYGGNTSCIFADCGGEAVIFDAGSGLLGLGKKLRENGIKRVHILLSHLHMDHVCGLYGFPLFLDPEAEVHLYGRADAGGGLKGCLKTLFGEPYWPFNPIEFSARAEVHEVSPGESFRIEGRKEGGGTYSGRSEEEPWLTVRTLAGNHPGGSLLYRLEDEKRSVIYGLDCEMNGQMFKAISEFAQNGSLLVWDANFTDEDLKLCRGWGHSSWRQGLELGRSAGVGTVLMTHYSGEYTDSFLRGQQEAAEREDGICRFAREGMVIQL